MHGSTPDEQLMDLAMDEARAGIGHVEPNPPVGAVLVREGQIIARGHHEHFGGPHAEVNALQAAARCGVNPAGATLYVTLEPCCHYGKTPPCTRALIDAGVARVVVAMADPDPRVAGQGVKQLQQAGIKVDLGTGELQAAELLGPYCKLRMQGRPWVIAKWAQTADGYLTPPEQGRQWISGQASRDDVHRLRGVCDGILIGPGTLAADDPLLTCRAPDPPRQPSRVVLDRAVTLCTDSQLMQTVDISPVIVAVTRQAAVEHFQAVRNLQSAGAEVLELPADADSRVDLSAMLDEFGRREWTRLLVEGGAKVLGGFLDAGLVDELHVYVNPAVSGGPADRPKLDIHDMLGRIAFTRHDSSRLGTDERHVLRLHH